MSEDLKQLICNLERARDQKASYFQHIRYPNLFITSLKELHDVIGNERIKKSIAEQIPYYIFTRELVGKGEIKEDEVMMNTVIFGKPGVGKTLIGKKLAKIWFALGCVKAPVKGDNNKEFLKKMFGNSSDTAQDQSSIFNVNNLMIFMPILFYVVIIISLIWSACQKIGLVWFFLILLILVIIVIWMSYYLQEAEIDDNKTGEETVKNVKSVKDIINIPEEQIVRVVSRPDFVDRYVGWSEQKTLKLLNENLGKVLVIDEAYSLATSADDSYGIEVLNTLNLFLSEHPNEIIVIFIGYRDLLEKGIFSYQPGLKRRTIFKFFCDGYTTEELLEIFIFHLQRNGWTITEKEEILALFKEKRELFVDQAGDVQRLIFFAKMPYTKEYLKNNKLLKNTLYARHVKEGLLALRENMIDSDDTEENIKELETMQKLQRLFQEKQKCQRA